MAKHNILSSIIKFTFTITTHVFSVSTCAHMMLSQADYERVVKDNETLNQRLTKAQQDYENQLMQSDQLAGENSQKSAQLKLKEEEVLTLKLEIGRMSKLRDGVQRRLRATEDQKAEVESNRESLKQQIASLEKGGLGSGINNY